MENKFIVVCYSDLKRRFKVAVTDGNSCISLSSVQQFCRHANGIYYLEGDVQAPCDIEGDNIYLPGDYSTLVFFVDTPIEEPPVLHAAKKQRRQPSAARVERWHKINKAVAPKRNVAKQSTACSIVTWASVGYIFEPFNTLQLGSEEFPADVFQELQSHLAILNHCNSNWMGVKESHRFIYINAIMVYVFMDGEFKFHYEADVNGDRVKVNSHFELVIECNNKKLCIAEAKKEDFDQGSVQSLLGCEALCDKEDVSCSYSIVTDYCTQWMFYESHDDFISVARMPVETVELSFLYTEKCLHTLLNRLYWFVKQFMEQQ